MAVDDNDWVHNESIKPGLPPLFSVSIRIQLVSKSALSSARAAGEGLKERHCLKQIMLVSRIATNAVRVGMH